MENIYSKFQEKLSLKIGVLIIASVVLVLLASGVFYISKFSIDFNQKFRKQLQAPADLMSTGKLKYDAAMDIRTMSSLVGDSVINSIIIGANKKIYYANDSALLDKNISEVPFLSSIGYFDKQLENPEFFDG